MQKYKKTEMKWKKKKHKNKNGCSGPVVCATPRVGEGGGRLRRQPNSLILKHDILLNLWRTKRVFW